MHAQLIDTLTQQKRAPKHYIIRTNADASHAHPEKINFEKDIIYLDKIWNSILSMQSKHSKHSKHSKSYNQKISHPKLIYEEINLHLKVLRDFADAGLKNIYVDDAQTLKEMQKFARDFTPELLPSLKYFPEHETKNKNTLFNQYGIEKTIQSLLLRNISLKSGGHIVIDQTEAMTTIDVNTGKYIGSKNLSLEETVFKTNLEATHIIAHQVRLRNLGGIILIDFIDMLQETHCQKVMDALQIAFSTDYSRICIHPMSELGLVAVTRKRTHENIMQYLSTPCPTCCGSGYVKHMESICFDIFRQLKQETNLNPKARTLIIIASEQVIQALKKNTNYTHILHHLKLTLRPSIRLQINASYPQNTYDIIQI